MRKDSNNNKRSNNNMPYTADISAKYTADEIGNKSTREELINTISDAPKGGIIHVHAYESKGGYGEVANYYYLKGVDYSRMKENSLAILDQIAEDVDFNITTVRNAYQNPDGTYTAYKSKVRTFVKGIRTTYNSGDPIFVEAIENARASILNPRKTNKDRKSVV